MAKYNNKITEVDGITFDSAMEANYYLFLQEEKEAGAIKSFELQPSYVLQKSFRKRDLLFRAITYKADFDVVQNDGTLLTIDIKGFETADFKIKKKIFEHNYPQELRLITYSKIDGGWIETEALKLARKIRKLEKSLKDATPADTIKIQKKIDKLKA